MKTDEKKGENTTIIHKHEAMSYGLIVKANDDVSAEHDIPTDPVIYQGNENKTYVARHFIETVTEMAQRIKKNCSKPTQL